MLNDRKPCENLASFGYDGNSLMTCDSYVAEKPKRRCKKEQPGTNKKLRFFCPSTCKTKCGTCENSASFRYKGNSSRTCESYVAEKPKKRCRKKQPGTKKKLRFFCPSTCKRSCKHTDSPSQSPIFDYDMTSPPTISRRDSPVFFPTNSPITDHDDFIRTPRPSMSQRDSPVFFPTNSPITDEERFEAPSQTPRTPIPTKSADSPDFFPTNSPFFDEDDAFMAPFQTPRTPIPTKSADSPDFFPTNSPFADHDDAYNSYSEAPVRTPRTPMPTKSDSPEFDFPSVHFDHFDFPAPVRTPMPTKSDSPDFSPYNPPISIQYSAAPVRTPRTPMPTKSDSPDFSPSNTPISIQFEVLAPVRTPRTPIPTKSADSPPSQSLNFV
jgi:hypothetical protein